MICSRKKKLFLCSCELIVITWSILLKHHLVEQKVGTINSLQCPLPGCSYAIPEISATVACALLAAHTQVHTSASIVGAANHSSGLKLERPKVDVGINEEEWNFFTRRFDAFVIGSNLNPNSCWSQLFHVLQWHSTICYWYEVWSLRCLQTNLRA